MKWMENIHYFSWTEIDLDFIPYFITWIITGVLFNDWIRVRNENMKLNYAFIPGKRFAETTLSVSARINPVDFFLLIFHSIVFYYN